mgnify:CR=1 FL=1
MSFLAHLCVVNTKNTEPSSDCSFCIIEAIDSPWSRNIEETSDNTPGLSVTAIRK